jgi:3-oxoacyl-[acyl-carrier protein] reductase
MEKKLNGKVALVTGASRGIGAAIAKRLAAEGAKVAITFSASPDRAAAVLDEITAKGGEAVAIKADSSKPADVRAAVSETVRKFGGLDILVNNAGVFLGGALEEFSMEDYDRQMDINVKGLFVGVQEAVKHMKSGSRIVNIGSCLSSRVPFVGLSVYAATKSAVEGLTRGLAKELGPRGITINNVQPGPIDTEMSPADAPFADTLRASTAVGRFGNTEEVAGLVAYLVSGEAAYTTGSNFLVDGGFAA